MYYFPKKITFKNMHFDILEINCTIMQFQSVISKILSWVKNKEVLLFAKSLKSLSPEETHWQAY